MNAGEEGTLSKRTPTGWRAVEGPAMSVILSKTATVGLDLIFGNGEDMWLENEWAKQ